MSLASFARLLLNPARRRGRAVYELLSTNNNLSENSMFLNLGLWDAARTYDDACADLARELARAGGMGPSDDVLDVGFGFGDQDMLWSREFKPRRITGLNITPLHVETARRRVVEAGLADRVDLREGSATAMPRPDASCDLVTALETAFHYDTREDFFREAFRVLRPGGRLAAADIIPLTMEGGGLKRRAGEFIARTFWQIPKANLYDRAGYARRLDAAGFRDVRVESIRERVYPGFGDFARRRVEEPDMRRRMDPAVRAFWAASVRDGSAWDGQDYVIATARKP